MLDHDEIERQGLKAITKVLLGFGGTVVYWGFLRGGEGCLWDWVYFFKLGLVYLQLCFNGRFGNLILADTCRINYIFTVVDD